MHENYVYLRLDSEENYSISILNFISPISLLQSVQRNKHTPTNTQQSSFNNIDHIHFQFKGLGLITVIKWSPTFS